jgi:hypothetical protein
MFGRPRLRLVQLEKFFQHGFAGGGLARIVFRPDGNYAHGEDGGQRNQ